MIPFRLVVELFTTGLQLLMNPQVKALFDQYLELTDGDIAKAQNPAKRERFERISNVSNSAAGQQQNRAWSPPRSGWHRISAVRLANGPYFEIPRKGNGPPRVVRNADAQAISPPCRYTSRWA